MTLQNLMDLGRAMEVAESQAQTMEEQCERAVNTVNKSKLNFRHRRTPRNPKGQIKNKAGAASNITCRNCGGPYPHAAECPAKDKECHYCKKLNHFEKVCKSKKRGGKRNYSRTSKASAVRELDVDHDQSSTDDEYLYTINCRKGPKQWNLLRFSVGHWSVS